MSERKQIIVNGIKIGLLGFCYFLFIKLTGISIPCPVNLISGGKLKCPGCGITRMCLNILKGDFRNAFYANPCLFILLPVWIILILIRIIFQPECLEKNGRLYKFTVISSLIILLIFGILRNIF